MARIHSDRHIHVHVQRALIPSSVSIFFYSVRAHRIPFSRTANFQSLAKSTTTRRASAGESPHCPHRPALSTVPSYSTQTMSMRSDRFRCFSSQPLAISHSYFPLGDRPTDPSCSQCFTRRSTSTRSHHFHFGIVRNIPHCLPPSSVLAPRASLLPPSNRTPPAPTHYLSGRNKISIEISIACLWIP